MNAMTDDTTEVEADDVPTPENIRAGLRVADRQADSKHLRVVARTPHTAEEAMIAATGTTVAEENAEYPADDQVFICVYESDLDEKFDSWADWPNSYLTFMAGNYGLRTYSFPEGRLAEAPERETDGEAEAVEVDDAA